MNDIAIILPLNDESVYYSLGLGHARVSSYDIMEQHRLMNWVMAIMSEVELVLGFYPRANMYFPSHLLYFDILSFVLLCPSYTLFVSFSCVNLLWRSFQALPRYEDVWVPNPKEPIVS